MAGFLPPIERISLLDGQTLSAADLNRSWENQARYRALHDRYLHRTWGIALGFDVTLSTDRQEAIVQPGYAIDSDGRDVAILSETKVPAPTLADAQVLLLAASAQGTCEWWSPRALAIGAQVPLLAAWVAGGKITETPDFSVRRYAHSLAVPRLATGATENHHTGWKDGAGPAVWIETRVDTGDAGFVKSPQYFATLDPPDALVFVVSSGPRSFVARVLSGSVTATDAEAAAWTIDWVGMESGGDS